MTVLIDCLFALALALAWFGVVGLTLYEMGHLLEAPQTTELPGDMQVPGPPSRR